MGYRIWIVEDPQGKLWQLTTETAAIEEALYVWKSPRYNPQGIPWERIELLPEQFPTGLRQIFAESP
jgi:hypothetical protein